MNFKKMKRLFLIFEVVSMLGFSQSIYAADMGNEQKETDVEIVNEELVNEKSVNGGTENEDSVNGEIMYDETLSEEVKNEEANSRIVAKELERGTYYITSALDNGMVLDVSAGSKDNGANIQLYSLNRTAAQKWIVEYTEDEYVRFVNEGSGKVLDVRNGKKDSGTPIQQYTWNGTSAQKWIPVKNIDGTYTFYSALDKNLVLDVSGASTSNGARIQTYTYNGTKAQKFELHDANINVSPGGNVTANEFQEGTYFVMSALNNGMALDVLGGSKNNSANIQLYSFNRTVAQKWLIEFTKDGYVRFVNEGSGKVLDVRNGQKDKGTAIQQYAWNGTNAQKWIPVKNVDGTYTFCSALDRNLVLDVSGASTSNGAKIQIYTHNGTKAQKFELYDANVNVSPGEKVIADGCYSIMSYKKEMVLDLKGGSGSNGTDMQLFQSNGTLAQCFYLKYESDGFYRIHIARTMKNMDLRGGGIAAGTVVQQWANDSKNKNQKWKIVSNGDHSYRIVSVSNGLSMDAGRGASGTVITTQKESSAESQKWYFDEFRPTMEEGCYILTSALGKNKVVDITNGSMEENANAQLYSFNKTMAQKWQIRTAKDGTITIQNVGSGLYLSVSDNGNVRQMTSNDQKLEAKWILGVQYGKGYTLKNCKNGKMLDVAGANTANGTNIATYEANGSSAQIWSMEKTRLLEDGFYEFAPCVNKRLRMDVSGGSSSNGANIQLYTSNHTLSQRWWVRDCGNECYTLTACCSTKVLDVTNASPVAGTNVQQWQMNGSNAQKWKLKMGKEGVQLVSRLGPVLDVQGGSSASGANVQIWESNGTSAQEWKIYNADKPNKIGWQNPPQYYQVSAKTVKLPEYCTGFFTYVTPSRISIDASRETCIETFIARAYEYVGTPYKWGYSCAPGVGVDCSGLVMQSLYATGMETAFNPYIHPTQESTTSKMLNDPRFKKVSVSERRRGDLIFYPGHVGIYLGNDQIINARPVGVMVQSVWSWNIQGVVRPFV